MEIVVNLLKLIKFQKRAAMVILNKPLEMPSAEHITELNVDDFHWTCSLSKSTTSLYNNEEHMSKVFTKQSILHSLMKFIVRIYALPKSLVYIFLNLMLK